MITVRWLRPTSTAPDLLLLAHKLQKGNQKDSCTYRKTSDERWGFSPASDSSSLRTAEDLALLLLQHNIWSENSRSSGELITLQFKLNTQASKSDGFINGRLYLAEFESAGFYSFWLMKKRWSIDRLIDWL